MSSGGGFVFAFFRFSQTPHACMVQRLVHVLTASDVIHVAVIPAWHCEWKKHDTAEHDDNEGGKGSNIRELWVAPTAFTAFMGTGFEEQPTEAVLTPQYDLMFLPVPCVSDMQAGVAFLKSLRGASYNYMALPLTILPRTWKRRTPLWPDWLTRERSLFNSVGLAVSSLPATTVVVEHTGAPIMDEKKEQLHQLRLLHERLSGEKGASGKQVFCSQMGLMLCYVCRALPHYTVDPAGCSPGELAQILLEEARAIPCEVGLLRILVNDDDGDSP
jgi:hypothetical protein